MAPLSSNGALAAQGYMKALPNQARLHTGRIKSMRPAVRRGEASVVRRCFLFGGCISNYLLQYHAQTTASYISSS